MPDTTGAQGRQLAGRYRLEELQGRGGMGTVWRGSDEVLGREVAVKEVVYPPALPEDERAQLRERTLREARATARLSHVSVVTVYDVVEEDGRPWIVMELVRGRTLADEVTDNGPVSPAEAARIGLDLLAALETAHTAGVLHRDVKPSNVLLAQDGRVVLTDFGIATVEGDPSLTSTGLVLGSPAYMAPERARGVQPGPASDIWGLGATLYAAVEGRPPFERDSAIATLGALVTEELPEPAAAGALAPALAALLEKDPERRVSPGRARALLRQVRPPAAAAEAPASLPAQPARPEQPAQPSVPERTSTPETPVPEAAPVPQAVPVSEAAPVPQAAPPEAAPPAARTRRSGRMALGAGLLSVVALIGVLAAALTDGSDGRQADSEKPGPADRTTPASEPSPTGSTPSTPASPGPSPAVPAGFSTHRDPTGFSIAAPQGWDEVREGSRVDFREPGQGRRFLRVDQSDQPAGDPVADWKRQEKAVSSSFDGYRRVRIAPVDYRGYDAADWEFTWRAPSGRRIHVLNRAAVTDANHAYAVYWSTPERQWKSSRDYLRTFLQTFQPER